MPPTVDDHPVALLLRRVQEALRQRLDQSVYRSADIYVTRFDDALPPGTRLPAIGIKDGGSTVERGTCNTDIWTVNVVLALWENGLGSSDAAVLGSSIQRGVLGMERDVAKVLRGDQLGCLEGGWQTNSGTSVGGDAGGQDVQQKIITYQYIVEDKWSRIN